MDALIQTTTLICNFFSYLGLKLSLGVLLVRSATGTTDAFPWNCICTSDFGFCLNQWPGTCVITKFIELMIIELLFLFQFVSCTSLIRYQYIRKVYPWLQFSQSINLYSLNLQKLMETDNQGRPFKRWRKKAYGGIQPGYPDNHTDSTFLQEMITNANVVKRDLFKVILDSISISQYVCVVSLVVSIWTHTLNSEIDEHTLFKLDVCLLALGFSVLLVTAPSFTLQLLMKYFLNISFFISGLYVLAPVYHTLTRSISSDSIWALTVSLLVIHLFLHDYSGSTIRPPGALNNPKMASNISLNASIVASVLIASRLPSQLHVFAVLLFSLQVFLFAPLVMFCVKKYSFRVHLGFSFALVGVTLAITYQLHRLFFGTLLVLMVFISAICPYWLIRIQEYKFEINGPWDEAKLCFDITE